MFPSDLSGILLALTSALVWGSGDFSGGLATRRNNQFQVLGLSALSGIVLLVIGAVIRREGLPSTQTIVWAGAAGFLGAIGIASLYYSLSLGNVASSAPTAAVVGVAVPVLAGTLTQG